MTLTRLGGRPAAQRSAWLRVTALRALIAAAAAWVVIFNVWGALGPSHADLVGVPWTQYVPSVRVVGDDGLGPRIAAVRADAAQQADQERYGTVGLNVFPWTDTADGTVDLFTHRPPVEWGLGNPSMSLWGPSVADRASLAAPLLAWGALALAVLGLLWRLVRSVAVDDVFTQTSARRVALIGGLVAVGGSLVQLGTYWLEAGIVARSAADGILKAAFSFSFVPLWLGLVVVTLAEVLRQGARLRQDVEGLV